MNQIVALLNPTLLFRASKDSLRGVTHALKTERAFQQEVVVLVAGIVAAFVLADASVERAILIGSLAVVLIVELLNSAIEATIDRIGTEHHELSGRAKDLGSAAVLVALVTAIVVWVVILT